MDINKFKNISVRLMKEMERNGLKVPRDAAKANLSAETGLREESDAQPA